MRDLFRNLARQQRDAKRGIGVSPVTVYRPKPNGRMQITVVRDEPLKKLMGGLFFEKDAPRPMSRKQIWKNDREGVMADAKTFPEMKDEKPKTWHPYQGIRHQDRMARTMVAGNARGDK